MANEENEKEEEKQRLPSLGTYAAAGLGLGGVGTALAGKSLDNSANTVENLSKAYFEDPGRRWGMTSPLQEYASASSRMANIPVLGAPAGRIVESVRNSEGLSKALGAHQQDYKYDQMTRGQSTGHYRTFIDRGPIAGYDHLLRDKFRKNKIPFVDPATGSETDYEEWLTGKLDKFLLKNYGVIASDVYKDVYPIDQQVDMLRKFTESLPPEEREAKALHEASIGATGDPFHPMGAAKVYASKADQGRLLSNALTSAGGAVGGGALGYGLYKLLKDKEDETTTGKALSTAAGAGLGGLAGLASTTSGRRLLGNLISRKQSNDAHKYSGKFMPYINKMRQRFNNPS